MNKAKAADKKIEKLDERNCYLFGVMEENKEAYSAYREAEEEVHRNQVKIEFLKRKEGIKSTLRPCDEELLAFYRGEAKAVASM